MAQPGSRGRGRGRGGAAASELELGTLYDLFSVVCHVGSAERGHYTAFCRSIGAGSDWHYYDDSAVAPVREDEVSSERVAGLAYLLFYARRAPGAKAPQQSAAAQAREQAWRLAHPPPPPAAAAPSSTASTLAAFVAGMGAGTSAVRGGASDEYSAATEQALAIALASGHAVP